MQAALDFGTAPSLSGVRAPVWSDDPCHYERQTMQRIEAEPAFWREFVRLTLRMIAAGRRHYGAKAIAEVVRFHRALTPDDEGFHVNNNHVTHLARAFARTYPEHATFFSFRGDA